MDRIRREDLSCNLNLLLTTFNNYVGKLEGLSKLGLSLLQVEVPDTIYDEFSDFLADNMTEKGVSFWGVLGTFSLHEEEVTYAPLTFSRILLVPSESNQIQLKII